MRKKPTKDILKDAKKKTEVWEDFEADHDIEMKIYIRSRDKEWDTVMGIQPEAGNPAALEILAQVLEIHINNIREEIKRRLN